MKNNCKRILSAILALVICMGTIGNVGLTVRAASVDMYTIILPRGSDPNQTGWGYPALTFQNGWRTDAATHFTAISVGTYEADTVFCIEPGVPLGTGDSLTVKGETFWENYPETLNDKLISDDIKTFIGRILVYGWTGRNRLNWSSANAAHAQEIAEMLATQLLIWETVVGDRDSSFNFVSAPSGTSNIIAMVASGHPLHSQIMTHYNRIANAVKNHVSRPSFLYGNLTGAQTHELTWDGSKYSVTLPDTNNLLGNFTFSSTTPGVSFSVSGSNLTISMTTAPTGNVDITATKNGNVRRSTVVWTDEIMGTRHNQLQDVVSYGAEVADPVSGFVRVRVSTGHLKIAKTSEDGIVSGIPFHISGNGIDRNVTTGANGELLIENLQAGTYTVTEGAIDRYVPQSAQQITVQPGQTATVSFSNVLKKFRVQVKKSDSVYDYPQGDASLENAKYGLYNGSELVASYYTDRNGEFTSDYFPCGENWTLREIEPGTGYLLDPTIHTVGASPSLYTAERNTTQNNVFEEVIKGKIHITKHTDNGDTQIETPEVGATFQIFLEESGSYDTAQPTERDMLIINNDGFALSKDLPYGLYRVHQLSGWEGKAKIPDFFVRVDEHGKTYYFIINNKTFSSKIMVQKRDAETGELIAQSGTGYRLKDPSGKDIVQTILYPTPTDISTFYTNDEGWLMLPYPLAYGIGYQLIEVSAPYPYVLDTEPVYFDVVDETPNTIVTVTKYNRPQKGKLTIQKSGEVFTSVTQKGDVYASVYAVQGLPNTVYDIYAAENILINNHLKHRKNDHIAAIKTDSKGVAVLDDLYIGSYYGVETAAYGYVSEGEPFYFAITYAGQTELKAYTDLAFFNDRQKVEIKAEKEMEQDERFGIGQADEILSVTMGLYAHEDITAADGKKIPMDGLLQSITADIYSSLLFTADIPVGAKVYVREIATHGLYQISHEKFPVIFEYAGQAVARITLQANNGKPISNEIIRGRIDGKKLDENGQGLAGALLGLFRPEEEHFTEETALLTALSSDDGGFSFEDIPKGHWLIREIAPPTEAYVLNEEVYAVTIIGQDEIVLLEIENRLVRGSVQTTKVDEEYPDNKLTGAEFEVFADTNGNGSYDESVDLLVDKMVEIEVGVYQLDNLVYGGYFLKEQISPAGFLCDPSYYYFEIRIDGETVIVENQASGGFINQPVTGELWLTKKDVSDGKLIPNCGVRIKDESGNIIVEGRTDENGEVKFRLRAGQYTYSEYAAPESYLLDESAYPFEITEHGQIVKAIMTNERIPVPKTGDTKNMGLWIGLAAVALGGLAALVIVRKKKDDEE